MKADKFGLLLLIPCQFMNEWCGVNPLSGSSKRLGKGVQSSGHPSKMKHEYLGAHRFALAALELILDWCFLPHPYEQLGFLVG
ncbi:MAG TPA: hypothetical protein VFM48_04710 [Aquabacterium sp.]|nr:hypothetical protein [Aquabacterium sp.]